MSGYKVVIPDIYVFELEPGETISLEDMEALTNFSDYNCRWYEGKNGNTWVFSGDEGAVRYFVETQGAWKCIGSSDNIVQEKAGGTE